MVCISIMCRACFTPFSSAFLSFLELELKISGFLPTWGGGLLAGSHVLSIVCGTNNRNGMSLDFWVLGSLGPRHL